MEGMIAKSRMCIDLPATQIISHIYLSLRQRVAAVEEVRQNKIGVATEV